MTVHIIFCVNIPSVIIGKMLSGHDRKAGWSDMQILELSNFHGNKYFLCFDVYTFYSSYFPSIHIVIVYVYGRGNLNSPIQKIYI